MLQRVENGKSLDSANRSAGVFAHGLRKVFSIDSRSLAAFRIGVGLILFVDILCRARYASAFVTDRVFLPRVVFMDLLVPDNPTGYDHVWSLHLLSGQWSMQILLHALAAWFAIWLLVGYRTRLAAI